jgi:XTP/dITP diphosphohydrolase
MTESLNGRMQTLLIATTNAGKVREIGRSLGGLPCRVIGLGDLPAAPPPVEETGATFAENALLKADYYSAATGLLALADDSGLEVAALGGAPGLYSARFAGEGATDAERVAKLLAEMRGVPDGGRQARFVCCIALAGRIADEAAPVSRIFEGVADGLITREPHGTHGFGFDPVFLDPASGLTFAELRPEEKMARSHRGRALAAARAFLAERLGG